MISEAITKMKASMVLAFLAGLATTSAVPAPAPAASYPEGTVVTEYSNGLPAELVPRALGGLEKRDTAGVYLCNDRNFSGYCVHQVTQMYQCLNLGPDLNNQVSSVAPDRPHYCFFFDANNCQDTQGHFATYAPGYPDLSAINFEDKISSYYCNPN